MLWGYFGIKNQLGEKWHVTHSKREEYGNFSLWVGLQEGKSPFTVFSYASGHSVHVPVLWNSVDFIHEKISFLENQISI